MPHHLMIFLSRGGAWLQVDGFELAEVTNNLLRLRRVGVSMSCGHGQHARGCETHMHT